MELEINKLYSETELRNNFFNVSGTTWKNDKERYLEHFVHMMHYWSRLIWIMSKNMNSS